jgi:hypothetical protein
MFALCRFNGRFLARRSTAIWYSDPPSHTQPTSQGRHLAAAAAAAAATLKKKKKRMMKKKKRSRQKRSK